MSYIEKQKLIRYIQGIPGDESKIFKSLLIRETVKNDTPFEILYKTKYAANNDNYGKSYNATLNIIDLLATADYTRRISTNRLNCITSTKKEELISLNKKAQDKNIIYIVNSDLGIYGEYNSLLQQGSYDYIIGTYSLTNSQQQMMNEYKIVNAPDNPRTKEDYINEYGTNKLIIIFGYTSWFILDKGILLIDAGGQVPSTKTFNTKTLTKIFLLYADIIKETYTKEQIEEIIKNEDNIIQEFNDNSEKEIRKLTINSYAETSKTVLSNKARNTQNDIQNKLQDLTALYSMLNKINLQILNTKELEKEIDDIINTVYEILDSYKQLKIVKYYNLLPYDKNRKIIDIEIITHPIPQNYIDLNTLNKCKSNFSIDITKLINEEQILFTSPMRMILTIDPLDMSQPLVMLYEEYPLEKNGATTNAHTHYYLANSNKTAYLQSITSSNFYYGCRGSFEPKMIQAQKEFSTDNIKATKQYLHLCMQYIQSTNVVDTAGRNTIDDGYYVNAKTNIIEFQIGNRHIGENIYELKYTY